MNNTYFLQIGPLGFRLDVPHGAWGKFFRKYYSAYIASSIDSPAFISIVEPGAMNFHKKLRVVPVGNEWHIEREDFSSVSHQDLTTTCLKIEKDRFSFNSWLRVFCSLYGLNHSSLLLHSAGIHHQSNTYLFPGRSGRGKSTITRLLGIDKALSDELVLVTSKGKQLVASSTPFWGELKHGPGKTYCGPVKGIYFLRRGARLQVKRLSIGKSLRRLLPTVLFFSKAPGPLERLFTLSTLIAKRIPAFELSFTLKNSREEILKMLDKSTEEEQKHVLSSLKRSRVSCN